MAGTKGQAKTGGIKKGGSKKYSSLHIPTVHEILASENCEPLRILARHANNIDDPMTSINAAKELCKYIYPTLRSVEVKIGSDSTQENTGRDATIDGLFSSIVKLIECSTKR